MNVTLLDETSWRATFIEPIRRLTEEAVPVVDFWPYFEAIPADHFESHDCSEGEVDYVYRMGNRYDHVLVNSTTPNVFMAIVVDLDERCVPGHRLINFNELYGLETPGS